jgi:hypothetical protein
MRSYKLAYDKRGQDVLVDRKSSPMNALTRRIAVALSAALIATTAAAPMASAEGWRNGRHEWQGRGHDDSAAWVGLGIAALAGIAIAANAAQAAPPVYAPAPAYAPPVYAPAPTCTTINGYAACIGPDGQWQYVR